MFLLSSVRSTRTIALPVAELVAAARAEPALDVVARAPALAQRVGVDAERVHAEPRGAARPAARSPACRSHVGAEAARRSSAANASRPARRVEAGVVGAEHAEQRLAGDRVGQHPEVVRRRPRRVREVRDAQVGPQVAQHAAAAGRGGSPAPAPSRPRRPPRPARRRTPGCTRSYDGPLAAGSRRRSRRGRRCRRAGGARTRASSWRSRCRPGGTSAGSMSSIRTARPPVSCPARPAARPGPGARPPGRRRTAPRTPTGRRPRTAPRPAADQAAAAAAGPPPGRPARSERQRAAVGRDEQGAGTGGSHADCVPQNRLGPATSRGWLGRKTDI